MIQHWIKAPDTPGLMFHINEGRIISHAWEGDTTPDVEAVQRAKALVATDGTLCLSRCSALLSSARNFATLAAATMCEGINRVERQGGDPRDEPECKRQDEAYSVAFDAVTAAREYVAHCPLICPTDALRALNALLMGIPDERKLEPDDVAHIARLAREGVTMLDREQWKGAA